MESASATSSAKGRRASGFCSPDSFQSGPEGVDESGQEAPERCHSSKAARIFGSAIGP